ncbi:hypothetical protein C8Q72DRAFT_798312 [Fomitopsis betulina]|nr:hypothetical protein C8Q72DRAFT_798312 [Fomitopsis betulina]
MLRRWGPCLPTKSPRRFLRLPSHLYPILPGKPTVCLLPPQYVVQRLSRARLHLRFTPVKQQVSLIQSRQPPLSPYRSSYLALCRPSGGQTHSSKTVLTTVIVTVVVLLALGALATCLVYRRRKKKIADTAEGVLYAHHRKEGGISENDYSVELASGHITVAHLAAGFHDTIEGQDDHTSAWSHTYPLSAPYSTLSSLSEYGSGHGLGDVKVVPATPTAYERDFPSPLEQSSLNATLADIPSNWSHTALEIRPNVSLFSIPAFPSAERPPSHFPGGPLVRAVPRPDMPSLYSTSIYGHAAPRHLSIPSHISSPPSTPQASVPVSLPTVGHPLQIAERTESPVAAVPPCVWLISERGAVRYTPHLLSYQVGSHGTSGDLEVSPWRTMEPVPDATRQYVTEGRTLPSPPPPPPYSSDKE